MKSKNPLIVGIGELLWELQPEGKQLGGIPADFVYHGKHLGAEAYLVSAIGNDSFGKELLNKLTSLDIDTRFIQVSSNYRTGTLSVTLDTKGNPSYIIDEPAAWDNIDWNNELKLLASKADVICFGTLAQRSIGSKELIFKFLRSAKSSCIKIFDINLRLNGYTTKSIIRSLEMSNIIRINKNELHALADVLSFKGQEDNLLNEVMHRFNLQLIALTKGNKESIVITSSGQSYKTPKVEIINHNGFGNGFTAILAFDYYKKVSRSGQRIWL